MYAAVAVAEAMRVVELASLQLESGSWDPDTFRLPASRVLRLLMKVCAYAPVRMMHIAEFLHLR